ncbi:MAG TPA: DoxX family protein [Candidatus Acidoferrum sp.]
MKFLNRLQPMGLLALRVALAIVFVYHGYPKLVHSNPEMQQFFIDHGLPGYFVAVAGVLETFGGFLFLIGLFTRPVALLLATEMVVAIWKVKGVHGALVVRDFEFEMTLCAACIALATVGAGLASIDGAVLREGARKRRTTD